MGLWFVLFLFLFLFVLFLITMFVDGVTCLT